MKIFDIMKPADAPTQFAVSTKSSESPTKVLFVPNNSSLLLVGTKNGLLQLWDRRLPETSACVSANTLLPSKDMSVMDIEINRQSETVLTTIGRKVNP